MQATYLEDVERMKHVALTLRDLPQHADPTPLATEFQELKKRVFDAALAAHEHPGTRETQRHVMSDAFDSALRSPERISEVLRSFSPP